MSLVQLQKKKSISEILNGLEELFEKVKERCETNPEAPTTDTPIEITTEMTVTTTVKNQGTIPNSIQLVSLIKFRHIQLEEK